MRYRCENIVCRKVFCTEQEALLHHVGSVPEGGFAHLCTMFSIIDEPTGVRTGALLCANGKYHTKFEYRSDGTREWVIDPATRRMIESSN